MRAASEVLTRQNILLVNTLLIRTPECRPLSSAPFLSRESLRGWKRVRLDLSSHYLEASR